MEEVDEPLTPAGRLFLQQQTHQIIHALVGLQNPIDVDAVKSEISSSIMLMNPRFSSLLVVDPQGRERWRRTQVDVDRHLVILREPLNAGDPSVPEEDAVNDYLADLSVSSPLATDKPLWELHLLMAHNCWVFRLHHSLGDGISLMSMLLTCCRRADDPSRLPTISGVGRRQPQGRNLWELLKVAWYTLVFVAEIVMRILWLKDKRTAVSGGEGVELWPRKLATAKFRIDDMKIVKGAVAGATINDVLFGVVSRGLCRYLDIRSPNAKDLEEGLQITGVAMVNLRPQPGLQEFMELLSSRTGTRYGNQFGMMLLPVYYHKSGSDPLQFVRRAKAMINKKQSLEALFSYKIGDLVMTCFGPKFASWLNYRVICNTTFTISNVIGPREEMNIVGNPVTYLRVNSTGLPHAITMHMVSYAGRADLQILVAKDVVPDPRLLAKCFEDALLQMKETATSR